MTTLQFSLTPTAGHAAHVRRINEGDLNWALAEGWKDFKAKRGELVFLALIYPIVGFIAAAVAFNGRLLPMFFPLVAGLSILGPAVASGFYELARRREAGLESGWIHFLDPLSGRSRTPLAVLTAGLAILFLAWLAVASLIYAATLGADHPAGAADFFGRLFTTPEGWTLIVAGNLAGLTFAVLTLVLSLVSFPMVVDKPVDAGAAILTSIHAALENPRASAMWGLRVAGLLVLGSLPMFVGLAVVLPVLGYATWHLYTRLIER
ncbi:MAG TPA: DUF2189 domain-containing protein [Caulobacteraceae bacterium]|jgi:uncharacterized membrane protein|nr:DUF2189 domain-containing protein [Caulobacteraceae bacterium]